MGGSKLKAAWDDKKPPSKGSAFMSSVSNHSGRVQVADSMRTHQELVENAYPLIDTTLPYHVLQYQEIRREKPDWKLGVAEVFKRAHDDGVLKTAIDNILPQVDCKPPTQAVKYSKWRSNFRDRMKTKGLEKTKATETMWSWQAEQAAKTHLRRHKHVIKHTPACVDHYPPEKAMQYRAWRRKTGGQHKVDAPLPRPKTANAVKWRTTFKQLNMTMDGLTKKDLTAPLLDMSLDIPGFEGEDEKENLEGSEVSDVDDDEALYEAGEESPTRLKESTRQYDPRSSMEIMADENVVVEERMNPDVETSVGARPSSSYSQQRSKSSLGLSRSRPATSSAKRSTSMSRPRSRTQPRAKTAMQSRSPSVGAKGKTIDVPVHKGRPLDFSRSLMGAYMGAASNDNVRALLEKTKQTWDK